MDDVVVLETKLVDVITGSKLSLTHGVETGRTSLMVRDESMVDGRKVVTVKRYSFDLGDLLNIIDFAEGASRYTFPQRAAVA